MFIHKLIVVEDGFDVFQEKVMEVNKWVMVMSFQKKYFFKKDKLLTANTFCGISFVAAHHKIF